MSIRTDVVYRYDGTLDGFLCCVYESYANKELPAAILGPDDEQLSLLTTREVETDPFRAARVLKSIPARISEDALYLVERAMLTCLPDREKKLLEFLRLGYRKGPMVMDMLHDDAVQPVMSAVNHLGREAHLYLGFVRFTQNAGVLAAVIEPKNRVLPLISQHFIDRYPNEAFIIFDRTHREALVAQQGRGRIAPLESLDLAKTYIKLDDATAADALQKLTLDDIRDTSYLEAAAGTLGTPEKTDVTIQLKWLPQAQFMGYYVALDKGYYTPMLAWM